MFRAGITGAADRGKRGNFEIAEGQVLAARLGISDLMSQSDPGRSDRSSTPITDMRPATTCCAKWAALCVIMPETPKWEGQAALNRIGGVIANTEFALLDVAEPVSVGFRNGSAEIRDGDTPESLIHRARDDMG